MEESLMQPYEWDEFDTKSLRAVAGLWLDSCKQNGPWGGVDGLTLAGGGFAGVAMSGNRCRMIVHYSGHVQGVGFRYTARSLAPGYEVTGCVRNLPDGRVELVVEGDRSELEAFRQAVRESGLGSLIRQEAVQWTPPTGEFRGFEVAR